MPALKLLFIGESIVLAGAIEIARSRGHDILGVLATVPAEAAMIARTGLNVVDPATSAETFVAVHEFDALFSIINGHILKAATLARPRLAAINYHNAPLPAHAGLFGTAWAILNGAAEHGATWHLMDPGIDTGAILAQQRFPLSKDETTASLNARCSTAALACLPEVLAMLERSEVVGKPQDLSLRTYHTRYDTAPNGGCIDWHWPAERIERLVRACDWGSTINGFGRASFIAPDNERILVLRAKAIPGAAAPGTVLGHAGDDMMVACGDGVLRLSLDRTARIAAGTILPAFDPALAREPTPCNVAGEAERPKPTIVELIEAQALADPDAPAIEGDGVTLSRGELAAISRRVETALIATELPHDAGVGILLPAGDGFVAAALGAMRAGHSYVPLDLCSPHRRHLVEIAEAGIACVLTNEVFAGTAGLPGVVTIDVGSLQAVPPATVDRPVPLDGCAYRVFTSGSTGRPKAVEIGHSALANLVSHYHASLPMGASDRMTMLSHPSFDASVADIWPILAAGGTLLIPPPGVLRDPAELIGWLETSRATCSFVPTAIAERIFGRAWPKEIALRHLLTGGDTLHMRPPPGLPFRVINTYGPTENTVDSLWAEVQPGEGRPVIGRPIPGVTATIIDRAGNPAIAGQIGELVLGGKQVAQGYRNRPNLTTAAFRPDPDSPGKRRYHTGDWARLNAQGEFEFHGRADDQVQVRGMRVELGEIEAILRSHDGVAEAACLPIQMGREVTGLVAYVVPSPDKVNDKELFDELKLSLERQLPPAIVPGRLERASSFPRTAAGKVDRNALADLAGIEAPAVGDGNAVRAAWRRFLPAAADTDEETSFWDLGGDSLTAIELLITIERDAGIRLPISLFLADPSLAGLQRSIACRNTSTVVRLSEGAGPPVVLWYGISGDLEDYQQLARHLAQRHVIGIVSPALADHGRIPSDIEEAVSVGLSALRRFGIFEAPAMIGFSWSGLLAFEAARQLAAAETPSPLVAILGGLPPFTRRSRPARMLRLLRWLPEAVRATFTGKKKKKRRARNIARFKHLLTIDGDLPEIPEWATDPLKYLHLEMARHYQPKPSVPVQLHLYRDLGARRTPHFRGHVAFEAPDLGWSKWAGIAPEVRWIDADHHELVTGRSVARLADEIVLALNSRGSNGTPAHPSS